MPENTSPLDLGSARSQGGQIALGGFDFQAAYLFSRIPTWLEDPTFASFKQEGLEDVDVRFERDGAIEIHHVQVKDHQVVPREFREIIESFRDHFAAQPDYEAHYALACPSLAKEAARIAKLVREIRTGHPNFEGTERVPAIHRERLQRALTHAWRGDGTEVGAEFVIDRVSFDAHLERLGEPDEVLSDFRVRMRDVLDWHGTDRDRLDRLVLEFLAITRDHETTWTREALLATALTVLDGVTESWQVTIRSYLEALVHELDVDPWTAAISSSTRPIGDLAQQVTARPRAADAGGGHRRHEPADVPERRVDEIAGDADHVIVLGDAGSGKSWFARRTAVERARGAIAAMASSAGDVGPPIPIFARCSTFLSHEGDVVDALASAAVAEVSERLPSDADRATLPARLAERIRTPDQPLLVVLDGLDEAENLRSPDRLRRLAMVVNDPTATTAAPGPTPDDPRVERRIVLTSRAASWREQLVAGDRSTQVVVELLPMSYPNTVEAAVTAWLGDETQRSRVLERLRDEPELAELATSPLLCAVICFIASKGADLPATRSELLATVVDQLLRLRWRQHDPDDRAVREARNQLCRLAMAGARDDPETSLADWPDEVDDSVATDVSDVVDAAVSTVAPRVTTGSATTRRFLHRSIRAHLVAEAIGAMGTEEAADTLQRHLWFDPEWEDLVATAITSHGKGRDELVLTLIAPYEHELDGFLDLERDDGPARAMAQLARETSPDSWRSRARTHIERTCERLAGSCSDADLVAMCANGWQLVQPTPTSLLAQLEHPPWRSTEWRIAHWLQAAQLSESSAHEMRATLTSWILGSQASGRRSVPLVAAVRALRALAPEADHPSVLDATEFIIGRLRSRATTNDARAYAALDLGAVSATLFDMVVQQADAGDAWDLAEVAQALAELRAPPAIRNAVAERVLDELENPDPDRDALRGQLARSLASLRASTHHVSRAVGAELASIDAASSDTKAARQLATANINHLVAGRDDVGDILVELCSSVDPAGVSSNDLCNSVAALAQRSPRASIDAAVDVLVERLEGAGRYSTIVGALVALDPTPTARRRAADRVAEHLGTGIDLSVLGWLDQLDPPGCGRDDVRRHAIASLGSADALTVIGFVRHLLAAPLTREEQQTVEHHLTTSAAQIEPRELYHLKPTVGTRPLTRSTHDELVAIGQRGLESARPWATIGIAELIQLLAPTEPQRDQAVAVIARRIADEQDAGEAMDLAVSLDTLDAPDPIRVQALQHILARLPGTDVHQGFGFQLQRLFSVLARSHTARHEAADSLIALLNPNATDPPIDVDNLLPALDAVVQSAEQRSAVCDHLLDAMRTACDHGAHHRVSSLHYDITTHHPTPRQRALADDLLVGSAPDAPDHVLDEIVHRSLLPGTTVDPRLLLRGLIDRKPDPGSALTSSVLEALGRYAGWDGDDLATVRLEVLVKMSESEHVYTELADVLDSVGMAPEDMTTLAELCREQHTFRRSHLRVAARTIRRSGSAERWVTGLPTWSHLLREAP